MDSNRFALWNAMSTHDNFGSFAQFDQAIDDPQNIQAAYNFMREKYPDGNFGSQDDFARAITRDGANQQPIAERDWNANIDAGNLYQTPYPEITPWWETKPQAKQAEPYVPSEPNATLSDEELAKADPALAARETDEPYNPDPNNIDPNTPSYIPQADYSEKTDEQLLRQSDSTAEQLNSADLPEDDKQYKALLKKYHDYGDYQAELFQRQHQATIEVERLKDEQPELFDFSKLADEELATSLGNIRADYDRASTVAQRAIAEERYNKAVDEAVRRQVQEAQAYRVAESNNKAAAVGVGDYGLPAEAQQQHDKVFKGKSAEERNKIVSDSICHHPEAYNQAVEQARQQGEEGMSTFELAEKANELYKSLAQTVRDRTGKFIRDYREDILAQIAAFNAEIYARGNGGHAKRLDEMAREDFNNGMSEAALDWYKKYRNHQGGIRVEGDGRTFLPGDRSPFTEIVTNCTEEVKKAIYKADKEFVPLPPGVQNSSFLNAIRYQHAIMYASDYSSAFLRAIDRFDKDKLAGYLRYYAEINHMTMTEAKNAFVYETYELLRELLKDVYEPKSRGEFFARKVYESTMFGAINDIYLRLHMGMPAGGAEMTRNEKGNLVVGQLNPLTAGQEGMAAYEGKHNGFWDQVLKGSAEATGFAMDVIATLPFKPAQIAGKLASWAATKALAFTLTGQAGKVAMRYATMKFVPRVIISAAGSAAELATFSAYSSVAHQYAAYGMVNWGEVGKSARQGALLGVTLGTFNAATQYFTRGWTGWKVAAADAGVVLGTAGIFTVGGSLETGKAPEVSDFVANIGMSMTHILKDPIAYREDLIRRMNNTMHKDVRVVHINADEEAALRQKGYDTIAKLLSGKFGRNDSLDTLPAEFERMKGDKSVSWEHLRMAAYICDGTLIAPPAPLSIETSRTPDGKWLITAYASAHGALDGRALDGGVLCDNLEQRNKVLAELNNQVKRTKLLLNERDVRDGEFIQSTRNALDAVVEELNQVVPGWTRQSVYMAYMSAAKNRSEGKSLSPVEREVVSLMEKHATPVEQSAVDTITEEVGKKYKVNMGDVLTKRLEKMSEKERKAFDEYNRRIGEELAKQDSEQAQFESEMLGIGDQYEAVDQILWANQLEERARQRTPDKPETMGMLPDEQYFQAMPEQQRTALHRAAEAMGLRIRVFDDLQANEGYYHDGTVWINRRMSQEQAAAFILGHEFLHALKRSVSGTERNQYYRAFADSVENYLRTRNRQEGEMSYDQLIKYQKDKDKQSGRGRELTDEEAREELAADMAGTFLTDTAAARRILRSVTDRNVLQRVWDATRDFIDNILIKHNWSNAAQMRNDLQQLFEAAMRGELNERPEQQQQPEPPIITGEEPPAQGPEQPQQPEQPAPVKPAAEPSAQGRPADIADAKAFWPNEDFDQREPEANALTLQMLEESRQQAHDYANGTTDQRPNLFDYWKQRDGLNDPDDKPGEPSAGDGGETPPIGEAEPPAADGGETPPAKTPLPQLSDRDPKDMTDEEIAAERKMLSDYSVDQNATPVPPEFVARRDALRAEAERRQQLADEQAIIGDKQPADMTDGEIRAEIAAIERRDKATGGQLSQAATDRYLALLGEADRRDQQRQQQAKSKLEAERKRQEEEKQRAEAERQRKLAEQEAQRKAEEEQRREQDRLAQEAERKRLEEEQQEEERKRQEEEQQRREAEERKAQQEAEKAQRKAERERREAERRRNMADSHYMPLRNKGKYRDGSQRYDPDWEQATAEQILNYLPTHQSNTGKEPAEFAASKLKQWEKAVKKLESQRFNEDKIRKENKRNPDAAVKKAKERHQRELDFARQQRDKWATVSGKFDGQRKQEALENQDNRSVKKLLEQIRQLSQGEYFNLYDQVARRLVDFKFRWDTTRRWNPYANKWVSDSRGTPGLGGEMLGNPSDSERKVYREWVDDKFGITPQEAAEKLYADMPPEQQAQVDTQQLLEIIVSTIKGNPSKAGLLQGVVRDWVERRQNERYDPDSEFYKFQREEAADRLGFESGEQMDTYYEAQRRLADPTATPHVRQAAQAVIDDIVRQQGPDVGKEREPEFEPIQHPQDDFFHYDDTFGGPLDIDEVPFRLADDNADRRAADEFGQAADQRLDTWRERAAQAVTRSRAERHLATAMAKQKQPGTRNAASEPFPDDEPRFHMSRRTRDTVDAWLRKRRSDLTEQERAATLDEIDKFADAPTQLAAGRWFCNGTVRLPEDNQKIEQAVAVAKAAKVDPTSYASPMELINAHADIRPKGERINPDNVPTLHRARRYATSGVVVYDVDESQESRQNMREIINTHFGPDSSPWCLLQGDGEGNLTPYSEQYWNHYNAYPKQVAFKDGKLIAFSAGTGRRREWWDRNDEPHYGIPITGKIPGDPLGRVGTAEISPGRANPDWSKATNVHRGNRQNGTYEEWHDNGQLASRSEYKDGQLIGTHEEWYPDGTLKTRLTNNGTEPVLEEYFWENGNPLRSVEYKDGLRHGKAQRWDRNGQLKQVDEYNRGVLDGKSIYVEESGTKRVNTYEKGILAISEQWDKEGNLLSRIRFNPSGQYHGMCEIYDRGRHTAVMYDNGKVDISAEALGKIAQSAPDAVVFDRIEVTPTPSGRTLKITTAANHETIALDVSGSGKITYASGPVHFDKLFAKPLSAVLSQPVADAILHSPKKTFTGEEIRQIQAVTKQQTAAEPRFHLVEDREELDWLDKQPVEYGYRNVVLSPDGTLGSAMASRLGKTGTARRPTEPFELNRWERSDEHPELATDNGKINLIKPDGKQVEGVDYNPYIHIRLNTVNKQFRQAWQRPDLVYVRTAYPASELDGGYHADKAAKPVGRHPWTGGDLILSRWDKPLEIVPWEEVANDWEREFRDTGVHFDIVPPQLLPILSQRGVEILPPHKGMGKACDDAFQAFKATSAESTGTNAESRFSINPDKEVENVVAETERDNLPTTRKEAVKMLDGMKQPFHNYDQNVDIYVSHRDADHTMSYRNNDQIKVIGVYDKLIANAVKIGEAPVKESVKGSVKAIHIYYCPVNIDGTQSSARMVVREYFQGKLVVDELHLYNAQLRKERTGETHAQPQDGSPNVLSPVKSRYKVRDLIHSTQEGDLKTIGISSGNTRFHLADDRERPTFYSNAERAVENVRQNRATAEQWKATLTKAGGIKAGEDKWMGLTQWLDEHRGQQLTKEQVLQFVRDNGIEMRETNYDNNQLYENELSEKQKDAFAKLANEFQEILDSADEIYEAADDAYSDFVYEMQHKYGSDWPGLITPEEAIEETNLLKAREKADATRFDRLEIAFDEMVDRYGDDFELGFYVNGDGQLGINKEWDNTVSDAALHFIGYGGDGEAIINPTRLEYTTKGLDNKREIAFVVPSVEPYQQTDAIHFGPENNGRAVMWVRFGETTDADGKRVLVIDEVQSNRHQDARSEGYRKSTEEYYKEQGYRVERNASDNGYLISDKDGNFVDLVYDGETPTKGVPAAPFERNWHEVAMKRMLRLAADEGFDRVAWTTGDQQAERYDISKHVDSIIYKKNDDGTYRLSALTGGRGIPLGKSIPESKLAEYVGRNLAQKIVDNQGEEVPVSKSNAAIGEPNVEKWNSLSGDGLRVGGEGMRAFYDKILPHYMDKYVKKWGTRVGETTLATPGRETMHCVDVTPEMKQSVQQGQPLFHLADLGEPRDPRLQPLRERAAQAVSRARGGEPRFHISDAQQAAADATAAGDADRQLRDDMAQFIADTTDTDALTPARLVSRLNAAMRNQRQYDRDTVANVTAFVKALIDKGALDGMTDWEAKQMLTKVRNATGRDDIQPQVDQLLDLAVTHLLKRGKEEFKNLLHTKASRIDSNGVVVAAGLEGRGARTLDSLKAGIKLTTDDLNDRMDEVLQRLTDPSEVVRKEAEDEYAGLMLAKDYLDTIKASESDEQLLKQQLADAKRDHGNGTLSDADYRDVRRAINEQLRQNKIDRLNAYQRFNELLGDKLTESHEKLQQWKEQTLQHKQEILHDANRDMQGRDANPNKQKAIGERIGSATARALHIVNNPLGTFDTFFRYFGSKFAQGEGNLFNRFVRGAVDARDNYWRNFTSDLDQLNARAEAIFGKDKATDLYQVNAGLKNQVNAGLKKITVRVHNGTSDYEATLTQFGAAYILLCDRQSDGRMKLRYMGIGEDQIRQIEQQLDPRVMQFFDWVTKDFLPSIRDRINQVYERMYGTPMDNIDNYFPLVINELSLSQTNALDDGGANRHTSTVTGSIIKRTRNNKAIDITRADALNVLMQHLQDIEHWAAHAELCRDLNTLLSHTRFKAQVINSTSLRYGDGKQMWSDFVKCCQIATGNYHPEVGKGSEAFGKFTSGWAAANIAYRLWTAMKQLQSGVVFTTQARWDHLAKATANPLGSWNWAIKNLPLFAERWQSRTAGDVTIDEADVQRGGKMLGSRILATAARWGITPNALIDGITVACGGRAIYETRLAKYRKMGYAEDVAQHRALQDAAISVNETQQSSQGMFKAVVQTDRDFLSRIISMYRNASMGFQRMDVRGIEAIRNGLSPKWRAEAFRVTKDMMMRDGLSEDQADRAAASVVNREVYKGIAQVAMFGAIAPATWALLRILPMLAMGDWDDKRLKKETRKSLVHLLSGQVEGLVGGASYGDAMEFLYGKYVEGEDSNWRDMSFSNDPLGEDLERLAKKADGKPYEAIYDLANLFVSATTGINPETFVNAFAGLMDRSHGDAVLAHDNLMLFARITNMPQSVQDQVYVDELLLDGRNAKQLTAAEIAQRYATFKRRQGAGYFAGLSSDEHDTAVEEKYIEKYMRLLKDRMKQLDDTALDNAASSSDKELSAKAKEVVKERTAPLTQEQRQHKLDSLGNAGTSGTLTTGGLEQKRQLTRDLYKEKDETYRKPKDEEAHKLAYEAQTVYQDIAEDAAIRQMFTHAGGQKMIDGFTKLGGTFSVVNGELGFNAKKKGYDKDKLQAYYNAHEQQLRALLWIKIWQTDLGTMQKQLLENGADQKAVMEQIRRGRKKAIEKIGAYLK